MWLRRATILSAIAIVAVSFTGSPASANGGCGLPPSDGRGDTVEMTENCFEAAVLHVEPGAKVTWVNRDPYAHTVTGVGGSWGDFSEIANGGSVSYRFDANGVYVYSCLIHLGMVGAVVVGDGSGNAGLSSAAIVTLPTEPPAAAAASASAETERSTGSSLRIAVLAAALGLAFGFAFATTRRRHRGTMVDEPAA